MTSCCPRRRMRWSGATGAIARCKNKSTGCARRCRSVHAWHWICGVKPTPKVVNKPSPHSIVHGLDKPGVFTTVSFFYREIHDPAHCEVSVARNPILFSHDTFSTLLDVWFLSPAIQ